MLPLLTPVQAVGVEVPDAETPGPIATLTFTALVQPLKSVTITVCNPAATFEKVKGDVPGNTGPPSNCQVKGAAPAVVVMVIVPSFTPVQAVGVEVPDAETPGPVAIFTVINTVAQPVPISFTSMV